MLPNSANHSSSTTINAGKSSQIPMKFSNVLTKINKFNSSGTTPTATNPACNDLNNNFSTQKAGVEIVPKTVAAKIEDLSSATHVASYTPLTHYADGKFFNFFSILGSVKLLV
jgi:hypothetical protein